ncbi:hypothetical protein IR073_02715 [Gemella sp. 19428wG2_WT2a]|nr:hypothetical protein [Gemella sp. 19428wG2_WT2a]
MRKLFNIVAIGTIVHILINILYYSIYVVIQENSILDLIFIVFCLLTLVIAGIIQMTLIKRSSYKQI